jgi:hypothetical protein
MQHAIIHVKEEHKRKVENVTHDLLHITDPQMLHAQLEQDVTNLKDARKILAMLILAVGQVIRDGRGSRV